MKPRLLLFPVLVSAIALSGIHASERPKYGGTLRVEIGASVATLDASHGDATDAESSARGELSPIVLETLVALDENGEPQPELAISWDHDASARHWIFHLRAGVRFHDGSPLTPEAAAAALASPEPAWQISESSEVLSVDAGEPTPDLPYLLAETRHALVHRAQDGAVSGTGPFKITAWEAGQHAIFSANTDYWAGKPFLDAVDLSMGIPPQKRMIDLQLGKADLVELPPEMLRRATGDKLRATVTVPAELLALVFQAQRPAVRDSHVREVVARAIDRGSIVNFILQKQGEAAASLLPQWISGTAFLFPTAADKPGAIKLMDQITPAPALVLRYDADEAIDQAVAERIAVNAKEAGVSIVTRAMPSSSNDANFDARIVRLRPASPEPRAALESLLAQLTVIPLTNLPALSNPASAEEIYRLESAALEGYMVVPIAHLPQIYGVGNRVRNWQIRMGSALGGWRLGDVWVEGEGQ